MAAECTGRGEPGVVHHSGEQQAARHGTESTSHLDDAVLLGFKGRTATLILSQIPDWCRVWGPCVLPTCELLPNPSTCGIATHKEWYSRESGTHLLSNHLGHHVPGMDIEGAHGHDLLRSPFGRLANEHGDEGFELGHLLLVIVLHGILIAFLQPCKYHAHLCGPPDLGTGQGHLWYQELLRKALPGLSLKPAHSHTAGAENIIVWVMDITSPLPPALFC